MVAGWDELRRCRALHGPRRRGQVHGGDSLRDGELALRHGRLVPAVATEQTRLARLQGVSTIHYRVVEGGSFGGAAERVFSGPYSPLSATVGQAGYCRGVRPAVGRRCQGRFSQATPSSSPSSLGR